MDFERTYTIIRTPEELAAAVGVESEQHIARAIYKGTSCGAYCFHLVWNREHSSVVRSDVFDLTLQPAGVMLGSIIEGSDACCAEYRLLYPFPSSIFLGALEEIEAEAPRLFEEAQQPDLF